MNNIGLHRVSKNNNINKAQWLLHNDSIEVNGVDVSHQSSDGDTALIWTIERGYRKRVKLLLKQGADVNLKNNYDDTALICATRKGYRKKVKLLLGKKEINVNLKNKDGDTALICAEKKEYREIVELLNGAKDNLQDQRDSAALMSVAEEHPEIEVSTEPSSESSDLIRPN